MPFINGRRYYEHRVTATYYMLSDSPEIAEPDLKEAIVRAEIEYLKPERIHVYSLNPALHGEDR